MLLDKSKQAMTIRAAKGLSESVIRDTRIRMGEGLCGAAAQENRPMIVDDTVSDNASGSICTGRICARP